MKVSCVRCDYCGHLCESYSVHAWGEDFCFKCFTDLIVQENFKDRNDILKYFNEVCDHENDREFLEEIVQADDEALFDIIKDEEVDTLAEYCEIEWSVND